MPSSRTLLWVPAHEESSKWIDSGRQDLLGFKVYVFGGGGWEWTCDCCGCCCGCGCVDSEDYQRLASRMQTADISSADGPIPCPPGGSIQQMAIPCPIPCLQADPFSRWQSHVPSHVPRRIYSADGKTMSHPSRLFSIFFVPKKKTSGNSSENAV